MRPYPMSQAGDSGIQKPVIKAMMFNVSPIAMRGFPYGITRYHKSIYSTAIASPNIRAVPVNAWCFF